jgi:hypothetical protein
MKLTPGVSEEEEEEAPPTSPQWSHRMSPPGTMEEERCGCG